MTWPCCQVSSTKGPLQTMLAASVHLSACFSTEARCAGRAARQAARTGKYPRGPSSVTSSVQSSLARTPTWLGSVTSFLLKAWAFHKKEVTDPSQVGVRAKDADLARVRHLLLVEGLGVPDVVEERGIGRCQIGRAHV